MVVFISSTKRVSAKSKLVPDTIWRKLSEYLGLSEYEAKVYASLIETGQAKARTLSVLSGVPRTKVYSVLKRLIDMRLVSEIPGEPRKFFPTPPNVALKPYLQTYRDTVQDLEDLISALENAFRKARDRENVRQCLAWIIKGRERILRKIQEMLAMAKRNVCIITSGNGLILLYKMFNKMFDDLISRSVEVKIITTNKPNNEHILRELKYVCNVKESDFYLPMIIVNVDSEHILISRFQFDNYFLRSEGDEAIFSNDPVLYEIVWLLASQVVKGT
ncbi:hypothetical protein J7K07_03070 [Candidatus Bathyarchaeota archaeon]|nr:hypothetical protein [Candidatus Bathyarchaeota archaeon]